MVSLILVVCSLCVFLSMCPFVFGCVGELFVECFLFESYCVVLVFCWLIHVRFGDRMLCWMCLSFLLRVVWGV